MKFKYDKIMGKLRESDELTPGTGLAVDPDTGEVSVVSGGEAANAVVMTTSERTALVLGEGVLIWDTDLEKLFVGDGSTAGGVEIEGGGGGTPATVTDIMTGSDATNILNVQNIRGALSAGQAVDVTSQPDGVTGDYKGTFTVAGTLGFASFPKYASGLNYLMIADLTATTSGTVTPSGTWLDGTTTAKSLAAGTSTRVAMMFNTSNKAKFTFASTGSVSVSNCREYEVTACSNEAIAYIAALTDPDVFQDYYLVKRDMVSPWTFIINMGDSPSTTVAAGLAYQINAMIGTHIITVDTCPTGYVGRDTFVRLLVGSSGTVVIQPPLYLASPLIANAINNCTISYRDGAAVLTVNDTVGGYVVDAASGTTSGTLYYGLTDSSTKFISIPGAFDGIPIATEGATVATSGTEQKFVVGNGIGNSLLSGNLNAGANKLNLSNVSLADVGITGGTLTLTDGASVGGGTTIVSNGATLTFSGGSITSGGTATFVTGGSIKLASIGGDGSGTLDLNNTQYDIASGTSIRVRDINVIRGSGTAGGFILRANVDAAFVGVHFSNCTGTNNARGILSFGGSKTLIVSNCTFDGGTGGATAAGYIYIAGGAAEVTGCTCDGNSLNVGAAGVVKLLGGNTVNQCVVNGGTIAFIGSNAVPNGRVVNSGTVGKVTISSGAILDLTGNTNATPINLGSGITFEPGGATVYPSAGSAAAYFIDNLTAKALANTPVVSLGGSNNVLIGTSDSVVSCAISGATVTGGAVHNSSYIYGGVVYLNHATADFTDCLFAGNVGTNGVVGAVRGGAADMSRCVFSGNSVTATGGAFYATGGRPCDVVSCYITGNSAGSTSNRRAGGMYLENTTVTLSGTTVTDNYAGAANGKDIAVGTAGSAVVVGGCTLGDCYISSGGAVEFAGNNSVGAIAGASGSVTISSGAAIALTTSINPGGTGGITVLTGGCVVNGATIAAGTYSAIISSGGSAVAS